MSPPAYERRRVGGRGRIGVIQPAPGVMLEHEWPRWLPDDVLFPVGRIRMSGTDAAGYAAIAAAAPDTARDLASAGADVIAFACTIGSLFAGAAAETALIDALSTACGQPTIGLADASVRALHAVGATRVAVMSPYPPATTAWVAAYLAERGVAVAEFVATPVSIVTVGDLPPAEIADLAVAALADLDDADALWIPCTAIQTLDAIPAIEARAGLPVVSGSQALLWDALRILGVTPGRRCGRLFG